MNQAQIARQRRAFAGPNRGRTEQAPRQRVLFVNVLVALAAITTLGLGYYTASAGERLRSPLHAWLKPSGYIGQTAGMVAFLLFLFLWLYPLRKKFRFLAFTGSLGRWLDVHIVAGLAVPWIAAIHASFRFDGLIGLGYLAMLTVSFSGLIGKYLYTRIPRSRNGIELQRTEIENRRKAMVSEISRITGMTREAVGDLLRKAVGTGGPLNLLGLISGDLARWKAARSIRKRLRDSSAGRASLDKATLSTAVSLARREIALRQQFRMLDVTHRLFRYWHVAHRPVAITALLAVTIHVAVVVALGVTWLW